MSRTFAGYLLIFSICLSAPHFSLGDSMQELKKIEQSLARKGSNQQRHDQKQLLSGKWFTAGTNFARLFLSEKGPLNLLDWLGTVIPGYIPGNESPFRRSEFIGAQKSFRDPNLNELLLLILVPHPKFAPVVELGLQASFAKHEPPQLRIIASETVELRSGYEATIYSHDSGACSLVVKGPKSSLLNLEVKSCAIKASLIDFAQKLDIERLAMKLQS